MEIYCSHCGVWDSAQSDSYGNRTSATLPPSHSRGITNNILLISQQQLLFI